MKVLLTGATGFIGSHVGAALAEAGHQLVCNKRQKSNLERCASFKNKAIWIDLDTADWREKILAEKPEAIIHCAWNGVSANERNNWVVQAQNISFFSELLELSNRTQLKRFIALGSQAEYGTINGRVGESHPTQPNTAYGAAKTACLEFLKTFSTINHLSYAWLRIFSAYGPGEQPNWFIPDVTAQLMAGQSPPLTACEQRYDYIHVHDLARGVVAALENTEPTGVFNLSSNTSIPLKTIVEQLQEITGATGKPHFGALPYRPNQSMHMEGDSSKFYSTFKFAPQIALPDGLRGMVAEMSKLK